MPISQINSNSLASGVPDYANLPAGSVLQVLSYAGGTQTVTSSSSFVDLNYKVTITPKFSTSKFLIIADMFMAIGASGRQAILTVQRNSTNLGGSSGMCDIYAVSSGYMEGVGSLNYLDSPNTASAITYGLYGKDSTGGGVTFGDTNRVCSITVMEIAA